MQTTAKCESTLLSLHPHITHQRIIAVAVSNNQVHIFDDLAETRVHLLGFHLRLQTEAVLKSLAQHGLGLDSPQCNQPPPLRHRWFEEPQSPPEEESAWPAESSKLIKWGIAPLPSSSSGSKYSGTPELVLGKSGGRVWPETKTTSEEWLECQVCIEIKWKREKKT